LRLSSAERLLDWYRNPDSERQGYQT